MRSTCARLSPSICAKPRVAEPMRTPSTSTMVLTAAAPRSSAPVLWPGPPLRDNCTPASRRNKSAKESAVEASMSARSITTTSAAIKSCVMGSRAPVTTTRPSGRARPVAGPRGCAPAGVQVTAVANIATKAHSEATWGTQADRPEPGRWGRPDTAETSDIARHSSRTPRAAQVNTWPKPRSGSCRRAHCAARSSRKSIAMQHASRQTPPSATSATRASGRYPGSRVPGLP